MTKQGLLEFKARGGARKGAGRKRGGDRSRVSHSKRAMLKSRHPLHVTLRLDAGLASLRCRNEYRTVRQAIVEGADRLGLRIVEYAVLSNHVHLVCEAEDEKALARGLKGVCVRIARALNRLWCRAGRVFADRYHCSVLATPRQVRNALKYVLHNAAQHGSWLGGPDPCSSGAWFDGWRSKVVPDRVARASPLPRAHTWLLSIGWRRHGSLDPVPPPFSPREQSD